MKGEQAMSKTFSVIEYFSHFAVLHNPSGDEQPMGDGVDMLFDQAGHALQPGSPGFTEAWEDVLNAEATSTLAAYFPQHVEDEE
jgi:hypothetical protein